MSLSAQKPVRNSFCSATRPSQPVYLAAVSAASTWSRTAGSDRVADQPYAMNFTSRTFWPASSTVVALIRPWSSELSAVMSTRSGPSIRWSMPAATRSPLYRVRCTRTAFVPSACRSSAISGASSTAAARGSPSPPGSCSLATSSDWSTIRTGPSTASTWYSTAATARWVSETSRRDSTRMVRPAGEVHSALRRSMPSRKSRLRWWLRSSP